MSNYNNMACIFAIFLFLLIKSGDSCDKIVNLKVHRKVDLHSKFAVEKNVIVFESDKVVTKYTYLLNTTSLHNIHFKNGEGEELSFNVRKEEGIFFYDVDLDDAKKEYRISVHITYGNKIQPTFSKQFLAEDQLMKFEGDLTFFSPYPTNFCIIEYYLKDLSLEAITENPENFDDESCWYESYNIDELTNKKVEFQIINNDPFFEIQKLNRLIDVNHFGKITIQDEVEIKNIGSGVKGPYGAKTKKFKAGTNWLYTYLPASAENIQFFDILGNNSQSKIFYHFNFITMKFKTRYPLLGGWKSEYNIFYQVPLHEYLKKYNDRFLLKIRAIDYLINEALVKDVETTLLLPEGARIKHVNLPDFITYNKTNSSSTSLSFFGRPTIVMKGQNLFEDYVKDVSVEYYYPLFWMLRTPFIISMYIESLFVFVICSKRWF